MNWFPPPLQPTPPPSREPVRCHRARGSGGQRGRPVLPPRSARRSRAARPRPRRTCPQREGSAPSARRVVYEERLLAADPQRSDPLSRKDTHIFSSPAPTGAGAPFHCWGRHPGGLLGLPGLMETHLQPVLSPWEKKIPPFHRSKTIFRCLFCLPPNPE